MAARPALKDEAGIEPRDPLRHGSAIVQVRFAINTLYHYPLSPFSRKVRLCLAEKKIEVGLVDERYWEQSP